MHVPQIMPVSGGGLLLIRRGGLRLAGRNGSAWVAAGWQEWVGMGCGWLAGMDQCQPAHFSPRWPKRPSFGRQHLRAQPHEAFPASCLSMG